MANERTEQATPKRRNQAREKGQVSKSQDLNSAVTLLAATSVILIYVPIVSNKLYSVSINVLSDLNPNLINRESFTGYFSPYLSVLFEILLPILFIMLGSGVLINYLQVGAFFSTETIKLDFGRLGPTAIVNGFKRFVNVRSFVELLKSFIKMSIVAAVAYSVINSRKDDILRLLGADLSIAMATIGSVVFQIMFQISIILLFIGIADKKYQDYEFEKSIKMTKEEIKDEAKNAEGDPKVKAKIKSIQYQFAMQRMSAAIPKADVVITNPTHYAIALRYDTKIAPAPQVVAKGVDYTAFKIREIAQNNNIPIVENKPLARTLYKIVPLEGLIPAELYVAVAEILAFVYKNNKGKPK